MAWTHRRIGAQASAEERRKSSSMAHPVALSCVVP